MKNLSIIFCLLITLNGCTKARAFSAKIPIDSSRWYQMNYTRGTLANLFDGNVNSTAFTGWNKILNNYDAYYPLLMGETMTIDSIRFYDKNGVYTNTPMTLSVVTDTWERIPIAVFTGENYNVWVGAYPSRPGVFKLDKPVTNIRYLVLNIFNNDMPSEIELYGTHSPGNAPTAHIKKYAPLKNMLGVNGFEWNVLNGLSPRHVDEQKMNAVKSFRGFRHYMDWEKLEELEGRYTFSPAARGGWFYDTLYKRLKDEGIDVVACFKTLPPWMIATYPKDQQAWDNNPVRYGASLSDPKSYKEMARIAFQYVARYGSDTSVDASLVSVYSVPKWPMDPVNVKKIGMGLIKYIECDNERDKWWKGRKGYLTGREYAANLSAFYDGHKNTMGAGIGVKNADPNMVVVMTGTASTSTDYVRGMIDWCKEFRGYNADGSVNLCWDVTNFHLYSVDNFSSQSGGSTRGAAPEVSNGAIVARKYLKISHDYGNDLPVWITEVGYDINQNSVLKAIPVGNRTALETQADWILRTVLMYEREGLQRAFFYKIYDDNVNLPYNFSSSGLINVDKSRKPAADFLFQANKLFGEYSFVQTLHADPFVDKYTSGENIMYALVVPDETGRTASYSLDLGSFASATIYTPVAGSDNMNQQTVYAVNGKLELTVTETPVFVVPLANAGYTINESGHKSHEALRSHPGGL